MGTDRAWLYTVAVTLVLCAPLAAFLAANGYPLLSLEVALLAAGCLAGGALLGLIGARWGRRLAAPVLAAVLAAAIDLASGGTLGIPGLALVAVLCLGAAWLLGAHAAPVAATAAAVFIAASLLVPGAPPMHRETAVEGADERLPVMLHVILDEHIGIDGLPELRESAGFARWLTASYLQQGFRIHAGAYSQYFFTRHSIANLLNFASGEAAWPYLAEGAAKPYTLTDSAYFRYLSGLGYRLHVYQSDYLDYCRVPAVSYAACATYRANSIGALRETALDPLERSEFIVNSLLSTSAYLATAGRIYAKLTGTIWERPVNRVGPLSVLPVLQALERDLRAARRGHAYFAHLLMPHYPYVLDASCRVRAEIESWLSNVPPDAAHYHAVQNTAASRAERYARYFEQVRCQQAWLGRLFDAMKQAGVWRDAIVVLHGDHGSRIVQNLPSAANAARLTREDFNDAFSTLFAVRAPGIEPGVIRGERPLQELLGEAFSLPIAPVSPKVYLPAEEGRPLAARDIALFRRGEAH